MHDHDKEREDLWFDIEPSGGKLFVDHSQNNRSGHLGHALVEAEPGHILAFFPNCSDVNRGHTGDGWMEYKRSMDGGSTWSEASPLPYSKEVYESGGQRSVMCEKALRVDDGTLLLFNLECEKRFRWEPLGVPTVMRSRDRGRTWSTAEPVGDEKGRIWDVLYHGDIVYALELANDSSTHWYGNRPEHHYSLYVSEDHGRTFERRSILPFEIMRRGYGALSILPDGSLIAYVYNLNDEKCLEYAVSGDSGSTWGDVRTSYFARQIRNPQIASFADGYVLHGRSGHGGPDRLKGHFVLYTSRDGINWDAGRYLKMRTAGAGAYSNNLTVHDPSGKEPPALLIQASHAYEEDKTNIFHWWLKL